MSGGLRVENAAEKNGGAAMEQWSKMGAKDRYEAGSIGCGALFTGWSAYNIYRGTNDVWCKSELSRWLTLTLPQSVGSATQQANLLAARAV